MEGYKSSSSEDETPPKKIYNNAQNKLTHNISYDAHGNCLKYTHFTPPSRFTKMKNPFEAHLTERFHTTIFSPSVFKVSSQQVEDTTFKWTIDEISCLKPADIDEAATEQYDHGHLDTAGESSVQAKIDLFFSKCVVPSPYNLESKTEPLVTEIETPVKDVRRTCEATTQTALSLPMNLPPELEKALQPYFNIDELECPPEEHEVDMVLYKKLFENEDCDRSDSRSNQSSPPKPLNLSPLSSLPEDLKPHGFEGNFESSFNLDECNLSPIRPEANSTSIRERKSTTRINYEEHMSVDNSLNLVPDICGDIPKTECNSFDYSYVSMKEGNASGESIVNWDIEYNKIIEVSTPSKNIQMDVSNSNTPKSSFAYRKKLSNSFASDDKPSKNYGYKSYADVNDVTDLGYQTGVTSLDDVINVYASTPSKRHSHKVT